MRVFLARRSAAGGVDLGDAGVEQVAGCGAWVAWRQGDTVTARHALREALDTDSTYRLAQHLYMAINQGIPAEGFLDVCRTSGREQEADDEAALRNH
ncbi:DUF4192 family protein [Streptomyces sp. NRRL S-118]|uniref:DUF4192 family protein n=1 Tax=Streptomyces sp. NRRL S-118 TaxID=1463881 RepID=UPI0004C6FAC5|nr:DUF4192 family protein [Streptomyces sp. NRRL S-118]